MKTIFNVETGKKQVLEDSDQMVIPYADFFKFFY
jgi:hypothetical protein